MTLDPLAPVLPDLPPEWDAIPPEILARLAPRGGILTPAQRRELDRIARARWFLIRNEGSWRCRRCGAVHAYLTWGCVERPWNGLNEVVGLLRQVEGRDLTLSGVRFGTIVPITEVQARALIERMRARGYPY
jgi:hypothetical protein